MPQNIIFSQEPIDDLVDKIANEVCLRLSFKQPEQPERYLTRKQVSEMLSVDISSLYRWNKSGYLRAVKIGGKVRYKLSDIQKLIDPEDGE